MSLWSRHKPSPEEKAQLVQVQRESVDQRHEAVTLRDESRRVADALKRSRQRNHYGFVLDQLFKGEA